MNFLIYPPLTPEELAQVQAVSAELEIVNALTEEDALTAMPQAVGMYGDSDTGLAGAGRKSALATDAHRRSGALHVSRPGRKRNRCQQYGENLR